MQTLEDVIYKEVVEPDAGSYSTGIKVQPPRVKAPVKQANPLFDEVFNEVPLAGQVARFTHVSGHAAGIIIWLALWWVGALSSVNLVNYYLPDTRQWPLLPIIWFVCIAISFYERAEMPPFYLLWSNPFQADYWKKNARTFFKRLFRRHKMWTVLIGIDIGSTFGGAYVFLSGKEMPFFIWTLDFKISAILIAVCSIIGAVCAVGPEPNISKHWKAIFNKK